MIENELIEIEKLPSKFYEKIDDKKIVININDKEGQQQAIYDVLNNKIISNKFSNIKNFEQIENNELALANKEIKVGNLVTTISCYIDKNGKIRTPLYNSLTNKYTKTSNGVFDYEEYIEKEKNIMLKRKKYIENNVKQLTKTII